MATTPSKDLKVFQSLHRDLDQEHRDIRAKLFRIRERLDDIEERLDKLWMPPASSSTRHQRPLRIHSSDLLTPLGLLMGLALPGTRPRTVPKLIILDGFHQL